MRFSQIVEIVEGKYISTNLDTDIQQINIDSRQSISAGNQLFIAISGVNHDAHNYIDALIKKGVRHFIVEKPIKVNAPVDLCLVDNSVDALQKLARYKRELYSGPLVGITGSNGKTIVKEWLYSIVSKKFNTVKSPKSFNSQIGVPLSLWQIEPTHQLGIIEVGISMPNEMKRQATMVQPTLGIFTNIGSAHGENFESITSKAKEKARLFKNAKNVICSDHQKEVIEALQMLNGPELVTWGESSDNSYQITNFQDKLVFQHQNGSLSQFFIDTKKFIFLENICHVIVAALELGIENELIQDSIDTLHHSALRLSLKRGSHGNYIVDDTYNNDMEGLKLALAFLDLQNLKKDRVLILSDLVQTHLKPSDQRVIGQLVQAKKINTLIIVGQQLKNSFDGINVAQYHFNTTHALVQSELLSTLEHKLILVKGSRQFKFEQVVNALSEKYHKTRLEIDLNAIQHNLSQHRKLLKPSTKLMVMVKAFAYGSGSHELARLLQYQQIDYLGVAFVDEGVELRKNGIETPIMVMNPGLDDAATLLKYNLEPEIFSLDQLQTYQAYYQNQGIDLPCHLILNTGMNRLGFEADELDKLTNHLSKEYSIRVKSIFTHLAAADDPQENEFTLAQINKFEQLTQRIKSELNIDPLLHCLNSAGIVLFNDYQKDMVRLGIGLHGISADPSIGSKLKFVAQLKSVISQVREVKKNETIGYGRIGKAENDMTVATIAIGYADGYLRYFGNGKAYMMLNGQRAYTIGNICMDMCMLDITGIDAQAGDEVIVFGSDPNIETLARFSGTIPYEILTNVSNRVERVFHIE